MTNVCSGLGVVTPCEEPVALQRTAFSAKLASEREGGNRPEKVVNTQGKSLFYITTAFANPSL